METLRFVHCADLHIDTPFRRLERFNPALATRLRESVNQSWPRIARFAQEWQADFVVVAGDVFDSSQRSLKAQLLFGKEAAGLVNAGIPVLLACGNHDPLSAWSARIPMPKGVIRFPAEGAWAEFRTRSGVEVAVFGASYPEVVPPANWAERYLSAPPSATFRLALYHGSLSTAHNQAHQPYAPLPASVWQQAGFDYWAMGHIHQPGIERAQQPAIVYAGNPQGRDFGEAGPRGCYAVTAEGGKMDIRFQPIASVVFEHLLLPAGQVETFTDLQELLLTHAEALCRSLPPEAQGVGLRIRLEGTTPLHTRLTSHNPEFTALKQWLDEELMSRTPFCWTDRWEVHTRSAAQAEQWEQADDFRGELFRLLLRTEADPQATAGLCAQFLDEFRNADLLQACGGQQGISTAEVLQKARELVFTSFQK